MIFCLEEGCLGPMCEECPYQWTDWSPNVLGEILQIRATGIWPNKGGLMDQDVDIIHWYNVVEMYYADKMEANMPKK